jgi:uncharacterized membrane protein
MLQPLTLNKKRIESIDLLRGLVMIIMALDHTRDFFHREAFTGDPLDLATTSPILFFTRWITHFCAPVFVFLSGTSIFLQGMRKSRNELSVFLFKRGLWLIFVELVIITFAWTFDFSFSVFVLQVIWAIGISMFLMGLIIRLPFPLILVLGLAIVLGHNYFDSVESTHHGFLWDLFRNGNFAFHPVGGGHQVVIIYPFVPWLGLMMLGYCLGKLYAPAFNAGMRKKILISSGVGLILFFVGLRYLNVYGDPVLWSTQKDAVYTLLSFINVHKYPPSLLYMCITIGPALLFLVFFESTANRLTHAISVYGRVPFFYYVLHFYLLHILCMILFVSRGHAISEITPDVFGIPFRFLIAGEGYSLGIVYVIWIGLVIFLYPFCKWFSDLKKRKSYWWLSYL